MESNINQNQLPIKSKIPLYGTIRNSYNEENCDEVSYILKEKKISDTLYRYEGLVFFGDYYEKEGINPWISFGEHEYSVDYKLSDGRELVFTYNTETNHVEINSQVRMELWKEEAKHLKKNVETDYDEDKELELELAEKQESEERNDFICYMEYIKENRNNSYFYYCFPRTKEGIAVSRLINYIFKDKDITIFIPKEYYN